MTKNKKKRVIDLIYISAGQTLRSNPRNAQVNILLDYAKTKRNPLIRSYGFDTIGSIRSLSTDSYDSIPAGMTNFINVLGIDAVARMSNLVGESSSYQANIVCITNINDTASVVTSEQARKVIIEASNIYNYIFIGIGETAQVIEVARSLGIKEGNIFAIPQGENALDKAIQTYMSFSTSKKESYMKFGNVDSADIINSYFDEMYAGKEYEVQTVA